ncbi:MAG TPA: PHP domain-containing protein, partial [Acidimicrobiales bacterium]|nr:PHP domain-containing protein [Acidimicrobiales bacterium]
MAKHLVDIDEQSLREARAELGTSTIRDTVNEALRRAAAGRDDHRVGRFDRTDVDGELREALLERAHAPGRDRRRDLLVVGGIEDPIRSFEQVDTGPRCSLICGDLLSGLRSSMCPPQGREQGPGSCPVARRTCVRYGPGVSFRNPDVPWSQLERHLSDDPLGRGPWIEPTPGDGGDSPAWSRKRGPYEPPAIEPRADAGMVPYAELHCHTNFSFLDGASHPEELAAEATRLGLEALAVTDHDGCYGVVRFAEAARAHGLRTVFGAELTLGRRVVRGRSPAQDPDPGAGTDERHLVVLARDPQGYAHLARAISRAQLQGEKGAPRTTLDELAELVDSTRPVGSGGHHWQVLTGCRKGAVP